MIKRDRARARERATEQEREGEGNRERERGREREREKDKLRGMRAGVIMSHVQKKCVMSRIHMNESCHIFTHHL